MDEVTVRIDTMGPPMSMQEAVQRISSHLQHVRTQPGAHELIEFSNGVIVQCSVDPGTTGEDGIHVGAVEILSDRRLREPNQSRLREVGWEPPQSGLLHGWWHLVTSHSEARLVAGRLVLVLPDVYGVPMSEVFEWSPLAPTVLPGLQGALGEARRPPPVPAGPRSESERFLAATVARWNAVATELDLPGCDPYVDEEEALLRCIFPEELIPGARARVDFIARRDRVLLEFAVDNEGSPPVQAMALALGPLMPDGVRLEILPSGHVYALADVTTATSEDLAELWVRGLRTLKVLWAATYPWDDLNPLDAEELGFSEGDFSLDGCEAELGHLVSCGAVYMSHFARQIDPGGGYVDRDYSAGEEASHVDLLRAFATGYGTAEVVDVYGRWIGGEVSSWSRMCCIEEPTYVAEQLTWEHQADRPGWQVETYDLTDDHQRMLRRLGWVRKDADSFALPALGSVDEGRIVARTSVEVLGANLDEDIPLKFNLADWRGARERLLEYLESGWPDSEE